MTKTHLPADLGALGDGAPLRALVPTALRSRLTRRAFLGTLAAGATAAVSACGGSSGSGSGSGGGLNIYTWGEYDDPAVLKAYTAAGGPSITLDSYGSNSELVSKLSAARGTSGYDICVPTHSYVQQMAKLDLIAKLDHSKLPNIAKLDPSVSDTPFDPGNTYSVCKDWGSTGYVYDTTVVKRQLTSWADFISAAQGEASGSTSLLEDQAEVARIYFFANGIDPNTEDTAAIDAYRTWVLAEMAPHVQAFASSTNAAISSSSQALIQCWNGDARLGILGSSDKTRYQWVWPAEGANLWQDNWAIVKGAKNEDAAYAFINHVLDPTVSLQELTYIGYNTGVTGIQDAATAAGVEMPDLIFIDDAVMSKLVYSQQNGQTEPVIKIYDELKAQAGV